MFQDKIVRVLGQGTFGKVVRCYDRLKKEYCAIKVIRAVQKYREASMIELRVLQTLSERDPENRKYVDGFGRNKLKEVANVSI